jgi:enoyl-CoA hydratase/carnithine racemase
MKPKAMVETEATLDHGVRMRADATVDGEATVDGGAPNQAPSCAAGDGQPRWRHLRIVIEDGWGTLTLHRPERRNGMSRAMFLALPDATAYLADEAALKGLVITGADDSFSVGGDLAMLRAYLQNSTVDVASLTRVSIDALHQAVLNIRRMPFPVLAAVNGLAAGAGFGLALACDDRVASPRAAFMAAYGSVGLTPDAGLTYLLPRIVGDARARRIILGDEVVRASEAERLGLVGEIVEDDDLQAAALRRLRRLTRWAPQSIAATKKLLQSAWDEGLAEHLQRERNHIVESCATEDFRIGVDAFHAGRQPRFQGR